MDTGKASRLTGKKIVLGVTGGIGAYKAAELVRAFVKEGADVSVVMTRAASKFITPLTLETLSRNPVAMDMFSPTAEGTINHIDLAQSADVFVVAPATANYLGKTAAGIADDLLTTMTLVVRCPVILAPAMNSRMWSHPAVAENVDVLRARGARIVEPEEGELACGEEGPGRLARLEKIIEAVSDGFSEGDLAGLRILVTAGPTREPLDPVRFLSNRSSGKMGYAIAEAAARRGGRVTLISGPVELPVPAAVTRTRITSGREMFQEVKKALDNTDWLIMAAAVGDFTPARTSEVKIRKEGKETLTLDLSRNPDILMELLPEKRGRLFVGFAAETGDPVEEAKRKIQKKGLDLIVANDVSREETGFASDENEAVLIDPDGNMENLPRMSKKIMAGRILDSALALWRKKRSSDDPDGG